VGGGGLSGENNLLVRLLIRLIKSFFFGGGKGERTEERITSHPNTSHFPVFPPHHHLHPIQEQKRMPTLRYEPLEVDRGS
jgi:hypothetical protein